MLHHVKTEIPVDIFWYEKSDNIAQEEQNNIKMKELRYFHYTITNLKEFNIISS